VQASPDELEAREDASFQLASSISPGLNSVTFWVNFLSCVPVIIFPWLSKHSKIKEQPNAKGSANLKASGLYFLFKFS